MDSGSTIGGSNPSSPAKHEHDCVKVNYMKFKILLYYAGRITQRLALYTVVGATVVHWMILIFISGSVAFRQQLVNNKFQDIDAYNREINVMLNSQSHVVLRWAIICILLTVALLAISRFRKYEKTMLIDSIVLVAFCLLSVVFSQLIVRNFIYRLAS